jgi:hypothetical protein
VIKLVSIIIFSVFTFLLEKSCDNTAYDSRLVKAERIIKNNPDKAYSMLTEISDSTDLAQKDYSLFKLLRTEYKVRKGKIAECDSNAINFSIQRMMEAGDLPHLSKLLILKGIIKEYCGEYEEALFLFRKSSAINKDSFYKALLREHEANTKRKLGQKFIIVDKCIDLELNYESVRNGAYFISGYTQKFHYVIVICIIITIILLSAILACEYRKKLIARIDIMDNLAQSMRYRIESLEEQLSNNQNIIKSLKDSSDQSEQQINLITSQNEHLHAIIEDSKISLSNLLSERHRDKIECLCDIVNIKKHREIKHQEWTLIYALVDIVDGSIRRELSEVSGLKQRDIEICSLSILGVKPKTLSIIYGIDSTSITRVKTNIKQLVKSSGNDGLAARINRINS